MKYHPDYPDRFESIAAARLWACRFFDWYNLEHYHSGLNLLTPWSVRYEDAPFVQHQRQLIKDAVYAAHRQRFRRGASVVKGAPLAVYINPPKLIPNLT